MSEPMIRAIVELPAAALDLMGYDDRADALTDALIEALDTPLVGVLDLVEQGEPAWHRSGNF